MLRGIQHHFPSVVDCDLGYVSQMILFLPKFLGLGVRFQPLKQTKRIFPN